MTPLTRQFTAALALLLTVAMVAVLTLRALGVPVAVGPLASPTPIPLPSATAQPTASTEPTDLIARIYAAVEDLRDLPAADIGAPEFIDAEELAARLEAAVAEEYTAEEQARDEAVLRGLGLLGPDDDYRALQLALLSGQVIGYYDHEAQAMVIVAGDDLDPADQVVIAHEYTHALQDAAFDLTAFSAGAVGEDDVGMARLGLVEGDATTVMVLWALQTLTPDELSGITAQPIPNTTGIPDWMVAQLEWAYTEGAEFVSELYARGGFAAVDAAFEDPPDSTEQVVHLDAYVDDEAPIAVDAPDGVAAALGDGWTDADTATMGEAMTAIWLGAMGLSDADAARAAAGWGGDALTAAVGPSGESALAWSLVFDAPVDAREFRDAYNDRDPEVALPGQVVEISDTEVLVIQATTADLVELLVSALGRG